MKLIASFRDSFYRGVCKIVGHHLNFPSRQTGMWVTMYCERCGRVWL